MSHAPLHARPAGVLARRVLPVAVGTAFAIAAVVPALVVSEPGPDPLLTLTGGPSIARPATPTPAPPRPSPTPIPGSTLVPAAVAAAVPVLLPVPVVVPAALVPVPGIPDALLATYVQAADRQAGLTPGCHLEWPLLAAVGLVESGHVRNRGPELGAAWDGVARPPVLGPVLDGQGFALIRDTDGGLLDGDPLMDRAVGPMQFIPSTWARWGRDGDGDGVADPQDVADATAAAAAYLCAGGRDLATPDGLRAGVFSYNHSTAYVDTVLNAARSYGLQPDLIAAAVLALLPLGPSGEPDPPASVTVPAPPEPVPPPTGEPTAAPTPTPEPTPTPGQTPEPTPTATPPPSASPSQDPSPGPDPEPGSTPSPGTPSPSTTAPGTPSPGGGLVPRPRPGGPWSPELRTP